ncbi:12304_t:CDS:2 [Funneliformis caledonium]|uniref:12304_t:CDS:1 n=1 Tax=Funneliformis caledonium TaxID=1117310 RepID=A0A9N9GXT0_9GLOM|nr:12304_t:CDS:2 [Funneliformis caledonium]
MSRINAAYNSCPTTNSKVYYQCCSKCINEYANCWKAEMISEGKLDLNCCLLLCAGCPDHSHVTKKTFIVVAFVNEATQQPISPPTILNACTRSENNECPIKAGEKFNQTLEVKLPIKKTNTTDISMVSFIPVRTSL